MTGASPNSVVEKGEVSKDSKQSEIDAFFFGQKGLIGDLGSLGIKITSIEK